MALSIKGILYLGTRAWGPAVLVKLVKIYVLDVIKCKKKPKTTQLLNFDTVYSNSINVRLCNYNSVVL